MTGFIPRSPAIVAATGDILEIQHITPEQEDILFAYLDRHGEATSTKVEEILGVTQSYVMRYLHDLADRGKVQSERKHNRLVWSRVKIELIEADVRQEYVDRIREVLAGRRDMASAIARTLNLPVKEVAATCTWMMLHGILSATTIGSTRIYAVGPRLVPQTDTARATSIPMSPEARLQEQLAKLGPERPVRMTQQPAARPAQAAKPAEPKAPKPPKPVRAAPQPKVQAPAPAPTPSKLAAPRARVARPVTPVQPPPPPPATDGWVSVKLLSKDLEVDQASIASWARNNGFELRRIRQASGRGSQHITEAAAAAYRTHRGLSPTTRRVTDEVRRAILADLPVPPANGRRSPSSVQHVAEKHGVSLATIYRVIAWDARNQRRPAPSPEPAIQPDTAAEQQLPEPPIEDILAGVLFNVWPWRSVQGTIWTRPDLAPLIAAPVAQDLEPPIEVQPEPPIADLEPPMDVQGEELSAETPEAPSPAPAPRPYVTLELEQQLRAELTPERRKLPGETARVAEKYGLSVKQVRNALSRIPV